MKTLQRFADRWLFEEYRARPEDLALFRIVFATYLLLNELPTGLWKLPSAVFSSPLTLAALFTGYPPHWFIVGLNAFTIGCACALLIGLYTAAASIGFALGTIVINSFAFADGKIDEGLMIFVALLLAFSGWGDTFSVDEQRAKGRPSRVAANAAWLSAATIMLIGFALFTAGFAKARGGWLHPSALGTRYHLFWDYFVYERKTAVANLAWQHMTRWGWKIGDWSTVVWEMGFVLTVFKKSWCRVACAVGALFHFGVWMLFDIQIGSNVVAYGLLVSWATLWPSALSIPKLRAALPGWARVLACAAPFVFFEGALFTVGSSLHEWLAPITAGVVLTAGLVFAVVYLGTRAAAWSSLVLRARAS